MVKTDTQPDGPGEVGKEKPDSTEVGGRSTQSLYICFNDGAANYIGPDAQWFSCWRCGSYYSWRDSDMRK